ncbi:MAG: MarR family transcriptional regulator [Candidatus Acidiferrales bacterium]
MPHRPSEKEKKLRAFQAYLDLLDAAEWFKSEMRAPLESFDLTMEGFRLLALFYEEGALPIADLARRRGCSRQNMDMMLARLEKRRWVGRVIVTLPPAEIEESRLPIRRRGRERKGQKVAVAGLTKAGKKFIGEVLPRHSKMVKALMRAITGHQQRTLSKICRQLRAGDIVRFVREIRVEEVED